MASPAIGNPSPGPGVRPPGRPQARVGSEEYHSAALPTAQEAALLYAAGHPDPAAALLRHEIKDPMGRNNKQAWLMLFDLYQLAGNRAEFDSLSMLFTVKFEQSPPAWIETGESAADPRRAQGRERKDFFLLKPSPDGALAGEIEKLVGFAESQGTVRIDLGKVTALGPEEAALFASALQKLRKRNLPMWFNNVDGLEKLLRGTFNEGTGDAVRPYWMLLFEIYILQGKMTEFEELGLEFAVAFEMSPPNWEVYVNSVAASVAKSAAGAAAALSAPAAGPEAGFAMKGVLSPSSANQLTELGAHAASRAEVVVDMSKLLRVEFGFAAAFFDAVKAIQLAGKRVILTNLNEINAAMLEAMGVNRYAILVRRKST